jgi:hypothetical protein
MFQPFVQLSHHLKNDSTMKQILFLLAFSVMLLNCKKDRNDPSPEVAGIVGRWQLTEIEKTENGQKTWLSAVYYDQPTYLNFRNDGVLLDGKELPYCCAPDSLNVNGVPFKVVPKADLPVNPTCALVDCATCPTWNIQQNGDEMIVESCATFPRHKYVRK